MSNSIGRRLAAVALGVTLGLSGLGTYALAHRVPACDQGNAQNNPHCQPGHPGNPPANPPHDKDKDKDKDKDVDVDIDIDLDIDDVTVIVKDLFDEIEVEVEDNVVKVIAEDIANDLVEVEVEDVVAVVIVKALNGEILSDNAVVVKDFLNDIDALNKLVDVVAVAIVNVSDNEVEVEDVLSGNEINVIKDDVKIISGNDDVLSDNTVLSCTNEFEDNRGFLNGPGDDAAGNNDCDVVEVDADIVDVDVLNHVVENIDVVAWLF